MQKIPLHQNAAVRDLCWSCFGPNLIDHFTSEAGSTNGSGDEVAIRSNQLELTAERTQWLLELDQNPEPLLTHLSKVRTRRLGHYFEALWTFFLLHDSQLELIANNVPVYSNKRTIGELDILYRDRQSCITTHLELAVKFYLNSQTSHLSTEMSDWLGPNCADRLDLKLDRFLSHQIKLSDTPEGKQTLADLGIDRVQKEIAIKGCLFYHQPFPPIAEPENNRKGPLSSDHQWGLWNHISAFRETAHQHPTWMILEKRNWLSPVTLVDPDPTCEQTLLTADQLITALELHFKTDQQPLMACPIEKEHGPDHRRYFVTPDEWPRKDAIQD